MSEPIKPQEGDGQTKTCNVCHLAYSGEECPYCKAEREHTMVVIQQRGRRHRNDDVAED
jgi:recombinational DNA repair protein RecR